MVVWTTSVRRRIALQKPCIMGPELRIFVSSVQQELEDERLIVQNLVSTDPFLRAHCRAVLYEFEPASPSVAATDCLVVLDGCDAYVLIIATRYGSRVGDLSITHLEYRRAKACSLPVLVFIKGDRCLQREACWRAHCLAAWFGAIRRRGRTTPRPRRCSARHRPLSSVASMPHPGRCLSQHRARRRATRP